MTFKSTFANSDFGDYNFGEDEEENKQDVHPNPDSSDRVPVKALLFSTVRIFLFINEHFNMMLNTHIHILAKFNQLTTVILSCRKG